MNREHISKNILKCLELVGIKTYPINPLNVAKSLEKIGFDGVGLSLNKYSEYASFSNKSISEISLKIFNSQEGASAFIKEKNIYSIFYNDTATNFSRIRFTLAHELAHIVLGHHKQPNQNNALFELEANLFAQYLLCHPLILKTTKVCDYLEVSKIYKISKEVAKISLQSVKNADFNNYDKKILSRFADFAYTKKCARCHKIFNLENSVVCPVCKCEKLNFYSGPEIDYQISYTTYRNFSFENICSNNNCQKILKEDFRYCPICKSESVFYQKNLLQEWDLK